MQVVTETKMGSQAGNPRDEAKLESYSQLFKDAITSQKTK